MLPEDPLVFLLTDSEIKSSFCQLNSPFKRLLPNYIAPNCMEWQKQEVSKCYVFNLKYGIFSLFRKLCRDQDQESLRILRPAKTEQKYSRQRLFRKSRQSLCPTMGCHSQFHCFIHCAILTELHHFLCQKLHKGP